MAKADVFLKLGDIVGESDDKKHKDEIEIEGFSFDVVQLGTASHGRGLTGGKSELHDLQFTKKMDKASPKLFQYCADGKPIKTATLTGRKAGGQQQDHLVITLTDVLVSSYHTSLEASSNGSGLEPMDHFSLHFNKIEYEYKEQKPDGSLGAGTKGIWNVREASAS